MLARLNRRTYRKGVTIFHEGDPGDSLHLIEKGRVAVRASTRSGDEAILAVLGRADFFGEQALLSPTSTGRPALWRSSRSRPRAPPHRLRRAAPGAALGGAPPRRRAGGPGPAALEPVARGALPPGRGRVSAGSTACRASTLGSATMDIPLRQEELPPRPAPRDRRPTGSCASSSTTGRRPHSGPNRDPRSGRARRTVPADGALTGCRRRHDQLRAPHWAGIVSLGDLGGNRLGCCDEIRPDRRLSPLGDRRTRVTLVEGTESERPDTEGTRG